MTPISPPSHRRSSSAPLTAVSYRDFRLLMPPAAIAAVPSTLHRGDDFPFPFPLAAADASAALSVDPRRPLRQSRRLGRRPPTFSRLDLLSSRRTWRTAAQRTPAADSVTTRFSISSDWRNVSRMMMSASANRFPGVFSFTKKRNVHCKKRLSIFPFPAGRSLLKLSLDENNLINPVQREFS